MSAMQPMAVPLGTVFSVQSTSIALSCNNRRTVRCSILCGFMQRLCLENRNTAESVESSESAVGSRETDLLEVVADNDPWWRCGRQRSPYSCKLLRSNPESCEIDASLQGREPGSRGASTVRRHYLAVQ
jgi:hypothetical protein